MSLDNIRLPAFLLPSIFGKNLVDVKAGITDPVSKESVEIGFLGGNQKKIALLVSDSENKFLADIQMKFLYDLLAACQLTIDDIAIINIYHYKTITHRELMTQLQPGKILMFGIPPNQLDLPFTIPFFQIQNFREQVYLISPSIDEIQMETGLKKQLWACLQKIFKIPKQK